MEKRTAFIINISTLIAFLLLIAILTNYSIFSPSLTGFTFANVYDNNVVYITGAISSEETTFIIPVKSSEDNEINDIYATIEIFDQNNNGIKKLTSDKISLPSKSSSEIKILYKNNLPPGDYKLIISIFTSESSVRFVREMTLKEQTITLESILMTDPLLNEELDIGILIKNHLENDIENLEAELEIYDENRNLIKTLSTKTPIIKRSSTKQLITTLNAKDIPEGEYPAKIKIKGENYEINKELTLQKSSDEIKVLGIGYAINNKSVAEKGENIKVISIIMLGLILINILVWIVYFRKNKK